MGEAKRRKQATPQAASYHDAATGKPLDVRKAGDPMVFCATMDRQAQDMLAGHLPEAKVPCNGCRECCWHVGVDVHPEMERPENLAHLDLVKREDGKLYLRKREDGACVHLGPNGCTVYQHRPAACRGYDCRMYALTGVLDSFDGDHKQPIWKFTPTTTEGGALLATYLLMGMVTARRMGDQASAHDVMAAVLFDPKRPQMQQAMLTLAKASPEMKRKMIGVDPAAMTDQQMMEGIRALAGPRATIMVRDKKEVNE